jgi:hypothetical protein
MRLAGEGLHPIGVIAVLAPAARAEASWATSSRSSACGWPRLAGRAGAVRTDPHAVLALDQRTFGPWSRPAIAQDLGLILRGNNGAP